LEGYLPKIRTLGFMANPLKVRLWNSFQTPLISGGKGPTHFGGLQKVLLFSGVLEFSPGGFKMGLSPKGLL